MNTVRSVAFTYINFVLICCFFAPFHSLTPIRRLLKSCTFIVSIEQIHNDEVLFKVAACHSSSNTSRLFTELIRSPSMCATSWPRRYPNIRLRHHGGRLSLFKGQRSRLAAGHDLASVLSPGSKLRPSICQHPLWSCWSTFDLSFDLLFDHLVSGRDGCHASKHGFVHER